MKKTKNIWYLVEKNGEYFAEILRENHYTQKLEKHLYRDLNGEVMTLTNDKEFAESWIQSKNEINTLM
jgi:hypothetical protein